MHCQQYPWTTQSFDTVPIDQLQSLEVFSETLQQMLKDTLKRRVVRDHGALPADVERLTAEIRTYEFAGEDHHTLAQSAARHVVAIAPFAHSSPTLKRRLRYIVGCPAFREAVDRSGAFDALVAGCKAHMQHQGQRLRDLYQARQLDYQLGRYEAPMVTQQRIASWLPQSSSPSGDPSSSAPVVAGIATDPTDDATASTDCWLRQPVVAAAVPLFARMLPHNAQSVTGHEGPFIHLVRLLALAVDAMFQSAVTDALTAADIAVVGGKVFSRGIKGYDRMWSKLESVDDHRFKPWPRPQFNLDVVRCLATFANEEDMRRGFDAVARVFAGDGYAKFKNGMAVSDAEASKSYHLRLVLGVGLFVPHQHRTLGDLREDPKVQKAWAAYLTEQTRSTSVGRNTWKNHVYTALRWIRQELPATTPAAMFCEVQMLLREYRDVRCAMHESYKIARATQSSALRCDFAIYAHMHLCDIVFREDGDSELLAACRDGAVGRLRQLLELPTATAGESWTGRASQRAVAHSVPARWVPQLGNALAVACRYVRPHCVDVLLRLQSAALTQGDLNLALRASCVAVSQRDSFALSAARVRIVRDLLAAKAQCDAGRPHDGVTVLHMAAADGFAPVVRVLLSHKANCNDTNFDGMSVLQVAARNGHADVVRLLLSAKSSPNCADAAMGLTALHLAAARGHAGIATQLVRAKANCDLLSAHGPSPCFHAAQRGNSAVVDALLSVKANFRQPPEDGTSPCLAAARRGFADVVCRLVRAGVHVDEVCSAGLSMCARAAMDGYTVTVKWLLDAKADVNKLWAHAGWSLMIFAAGGGHAKVVELLVERAPHLCAVPTTGGFTHWGQHIPRGSLPVQVAEMLGREEAFNVLASRL